ncbi:MAG: serine hydrolase domain-containing protein [Alphaproteobacteria bacterium]|nr:serine hydrolase domain-containing protein [Alphaproteobacteria bacterium]
MTDDRSSILLADKAAAQEAEQAKLAALEAGLFQMYEDLRIAGMAAGILRGRELLWFRGFGYADLAEKTPVTRDTPFHLASLTKTFASTLIMQLFEQGKLDLDTPAADFGIELKSRGTITVRHLMSHTSGGKPGGRYRYDGSRFGQLDRVLEQITSRSFKENVDETIVRPLGLNNTGRMGDALETKLASPYKLNSEGDLVRGAYPTFFGSSAGLVASVSDYAQYIVALKDNRFLRPETLALAMTPTKSTAGHDLPYGLGWFVETVKGTKVIWHYGYWDSVSTLVVIVPEQDLTSFVFANTDALSRGFDLGRGHIVRSPAGLKFLESLVFNQD